MKSPRKRNNNKNKKKYVQYTFYVPENDYALCNFLEAQSYVSNSVRTILKAFISRMRDEGIIGDDVECADFAAVLRAADPAPLAGIWDNERPRPRHEGPEGAAAMRQSHGMAAGSASTVRQNTGGAVQPAETPGQPARQAGEAPVAQHARATVQNTVDRAVQGAASVGRQVHDQAEAQVIREQIRAQTEAVMAAAAQAAQEPGPVTDGGASPDIASGPVPEEAQGTVLGEPITAQEADVDEADMMGGIDPDGMDDTGTTAQIDDTPDIPSGMPEIPEDTAVTEAVQDDTAKPDGASLRAQYHEKNGGEVVPFEDIDMDDFSEY